MKTSFRKSFARDLKKIKNKQVLELVSKTIEGVEEAESLEDVGSVKKLAGTDNCFRIRVGDYRIGVIIEGEKMEFVRCMHRKDLFRFFP